MKTFTYHNDKKFKRDFVRETRWHREQDRYVPGIYGNGDLEHFKGCSLGCSVNSLKRLVKNSIAFGDHAGCANLLGWPVWLCHLQDTIFEGLPKSERNEWTESLAAAVPVGKDIEPIKWHFSAFLLKENIERVLALTLDEKLKEQVVSAIRQCLAVQESAIKSGKWHTESARAAYRAAYRAAASAAYSAADSAADSAARAAYSAADSAARAAYSAADSAAASAAYSAAYSRYSKELLSLLKKAK